ncbi:hypothetical protein [Larsenimonas rhizosphaerae]|uniref:Uncharacterized protein n=1 Tax=Larsenimonas rhizosphaerae TaxID=2944682 RepID=A0AA42CWQ9_9GAMM|nr:hypothetical protein [Larsenimonas rhizosphaerae]MCM2130246.1 hypothetical protein [Larsenimonas rhizosphaerae]MCX2522950.1 hypothetical protein [Larsenimonas rhizosphaerae]
MSRIFLSFTIYEALLIVPFLMLTMWLLLWLFRGPLDMTMSNAEHDEELDTFQPRPWIRLPRFRREKDDNKNMGL